MADAPAPAPAPRSPALVPVDLARGFGIGMAELVPGFSGGTVALVTGVHEELLDSASHVLGAGRRLVTGPDRVRSAAAELRRADWRLVVPVLVGMVLALLLAAGLVGAWVEDHPAHARGLFLGMVVASLAVPVRMIGSEVRLRGADVVPVLAAAVVAFVSVGLVDDVVVSDPPVLAVFGAAAVAVCALVLPGVSGSFFLLAVGLYATTLGALDDRDLAYLAVFGAGAVTGLALFVPVVHRLLEHHRRATLLVMTGLLLGSLRALWPWQGGPEASEGAGGLLAPHDPVAGPVLLALLGAGVVAVVVTVEARRGADRPG